MPSANARAERSQATRRQLDAISEATEQMLALPKDAPTGDTAVPTGHLHALPANQRIMDASPRG